MNNIIIIGMAGVGKTTVGKLLAEKLGMAFFDLDKNIEIRCGVEISRIFEIEGEVGFRDRETDELQRIFNMYSNFILSVGGGCVAQLINREILGQACFLARLHTKYSKKCFYVLEWINVGHSKTDLSLVLI